MTTDTTTSSALSAKAPAPEPVLPMINLHHVSVHFGSTTAVADVSLTVDAGEWVGVIGPNGAGKTSLLRAMARVLSHDGELHIRGHAIRDLPRRQQAQLVAYVPQKPELPPDMSVIDYVLLGRTPHIGYFGAESTQDRRVAAQLLERLDLITMATRHLSTLSGGELQRVVLARALAQESPVLLLDEPTSALDLGRRVDVLELVDELRRERDLTIVSCLHDLTLAGQFADRLLLMAAGAVVAAGSPGVVLQADLLAAHYGHRVNVITTDVGELVVVPQRARRHRPDGGTR